MTNDVITTVDAEEYKRGLEKLNSIHSKLVIRHGSFSGGSRTIDDSEVLKRT